MLDVPGGKSYIAGPSAGREDNGFPAFRFAERVLTEQDYEVVSPVDNCPPEVAEKAERLGLAFKQTPEYAQLIEQGVRQVLDCVRVFLLEGWSSSTGAQLENNVARLTGRWVYKFQASGQHILLHEGTVRGIVVEEDAAR